VKPGSNEYKDIVAEFSKTMRLEVDNVERIENGAQHELFSVCKRNIARDLNLPVDDKSYVRYLFHGTSLDGITSIVNNTTAGFSPLLSGTCTGAIWGDGTYFARDASYSDNYACTLPTGQKKMLIAEVVIGKFTKGAKRMNICPILPGEKCRRFNSLVDDEKRPSIFVVQHTMQAYPAYLITYH
jgi:poly [ADP-ribose] polymerase 7/11/12/13